MTLEEVRNCVVDACERGYLLTDDELGMSLIDPRDVVQSGCGVFTARFRLQTRERYFVDALVNRVCSELGCPRHFFIKEMSEWGIPFLDAAWVICPGESGR